MQPAVNQAEPAIGAIAEPRTIRRAIAALLVSIFVFTIQPFDLIAQEPKALHGRVHDPLGDVVGAASVDLLADAEVIATTSTVADGGFEFRISKSGRYAIRVSAPTFQTVTTSAIYLGNSARDEVEITLPLQNVKQQVTVTATGTPIPEAQIGASITVLPSEDYRYMTEVQEPLRLIPGLQVTQSGQMGGTSGLSIRGGETTANKVLIDGVPANTIGGGVELANLATVGFGTTEVLREPNSALYGSDALAGVASLTTSRGTTPLPLFTYAGDAGNFGTYRNEVTASTGYRQFDLYSAFARIDTDNNIPNSEFHNATYAGNFGWTPNTANDLRFTVRHVIGQLAQSDSLWRPATERSIQ
jgi:vitamin B12 transporter